MYRVSLSSLFCALSASGIWSEAGGRGGSSRSLFLCIYMAIGVTWQPFVPTDNRWRHSPMGLVVPSLHLRMATRMLVQSYACLWSLPLLQGLRIW